MRIIKRNEKEFPEKLKNIKPIIKQIYIEGNINNLNEFGIAIIGSRNSSKEGEKITKEFTKKLTQKGINIISGMAVGIDSIAHTTCLQNGGKTIAVLGSGLNNIYPKENYKLYKDILETGGTIVTEYSPEIPPKPKNFPLRNRIVSGLCEGIIVIEGKGRSGTTITGKYGIEQGKEVFCIPHGINNSYGTGPNTLIKQGAKLVTSVSEILERFEQKGIKFQIHIKQKQYKDEILKLLSEEILTKEQLAIKTNKSIAEINQRITILELEEKITEEYGKGYRIIE